jgi:dihydrofolate reductase
MRKLIVANPVTLDGVMEAPERWQHPFHSEAVERAIVDQISGMGALLLGRVTYEIFAATWPSQTGAMFERLNALPKYVVSTTLDEPTWENSTVIRENVPAEVASLKQQPGKDILTLGSADLVHTLRQHDLVDEYRLLVYPVVFGSGKRLFENGIAPTTLRLIDAKPFDVGAVLLTYEPVREVSA